jgi:hypothetical protein
VTLRNTLRYLALDLRDLGDRSGDRLPDFDALLGKVAKRIAGLLDSGEAEDVALGIEHTETLYRLQLRARKLEQEYLMRMGEATVTQRLGELQATVDQGSAAAQQVSQAALLELIQGMSRQESAE